MQPTFIGIADRITRPGGVHSAIPTDIYGLRYVFISSLFPLSIQNVDWVFVFPSGFSPRGRLNLSVVERPKDRYWLEYSLDGESSQDQRLERSMVVDFSFRGSGGPVIWEPCKVDVALECEDGRFELGQAEFVYAAAPPLSDSIRNAIESNPTLRKFIRIRIHCSTCQDGLTPFTGLSRPKLSEKDRSVPRLTWFEDLPDQFVCTCGSVSAPLKYLRESMQGLLANVNSVKPDGSIATRTLPLSLDEVERVLDSFRRLIDAEPPESDVQDFIQRNPILLSPFAANRLFFKPQILNKYRADFAIVNSRKELLFIEIERPGLKVFRVDGMQTQDLTHAFAQTSAWNNEFVENRPAVLRCLDGCPQDISTVRYLVIAGRANSCDSEALDRLLRAPGHCGFMTYDHLMEDVRNTLRQAV